MVVRFSQSDFLLMDYSGLSKDVENHFVNLCLHDRRFHRRRQIFVTYFRIVADTSPMALFLVFSTPDDVYSDHGEHSEMLRLFIIGIGFLMFRF